MCQKDLGGKILKSGGNITMVVDNLEKQGYVKRERGKDRRFYTILLTDNGKEVIEKIFPKQLAIILEEMSILTEEEQLELQRLCKQIGLKKKIRKAI
jgi:MarR family 2-MHQ and catechol resistance regulon transcriptional repressor